MWKSFLSSLQSMFDYLDNAVIKLCEMSPVGTDLGTVKQQIEELKVGTTVFLTCCVIKPFPEIRCVTSCSLPPHRPEQQYKVEVYQQQIDMEKLSHQGELLLKKVSDQTDRDMIQEPLTELRHLWDNLGDKITQRQVLKRV